VNFLKIHTVVLVLLSVSFLLSGDERYEPICFLLCLRNVSAIDALVCVRALADKFRFIAGGVTFGERERLRLFAEFSSKNIRGSTELSSLSFESAYLQHFRT
jgi:hypothetical protein